MDTLSLLLHGFEVALQPMNLMWALIGSVLGTAIGILPGIGPALTIALLLPVTVSVAESFRSFPWTRRTMTAQPTKLPIPPRPTRKRNPLNAKIATTCMSCSKTWTKRTAPRSSCGTGTTTPRSKSPIR